MSVNKKNSDGSYNQYASKPYVTKDNIGLSKVENKSSEDIRGEITSKNVTDALGYTPVNPNPQFIYDTEAKMTKVVPDGVNKGIVAMIGGKTVKSKNLIPFPYYSESGSVIGNVTYTYDEDGIITMNGTASGSQSFHIIPSAHPLIFTPNKSYTLTITTTIKIWLEFGTCLNGNNVDDIRNGRVTENKKVITFTMPQRFEGTTERYNGIKLYIRRADDGDVYENNKVTIQLEEGSEATTYEPYFEGLHNAPVEKIVTTNVIKSDFGALTKVSGRYGYDFNNLKSGEYEVTITNSSSKALSIDVYHNGAFSGNAKIVNANKTKTEAFNVADGDSIVVYCGSGVTVNPISFISVSIGGKPFVKEISLSDAIKNLPDYGASAGDVYNYVDFEEMVYHHKVGNIAMKDHLPSSWSYIEASKRYVSDYWASTINLKIPPTSLILPNIVINNYSVSEWSNVADISKDKTIYISTSGGICVRNLAATTAAQLNTLLQDTVLNYELETEELIDISDILPPFMLESGGTITFENEHNLDVPNTVIYEKEMI